jgi:hypothetical protein
MILPRLLPLPALALLLLLPRPAAPCSLCGGDLKSRLTLRQEAGRPTARMILYGTIRNKRDSTVSELVLNSILRSNPFLKGKTFLTLPRFYPVNDAKLIVFCDLDKGKIDPYRGVPIKGASAVDYLKKALALNKKDVVGNLAFFFRYLNDADPEVSRDAFLEFAKTGDQDIARAAPKLSADKLRTWLKDAKTPPERLSVYALLLGACGKEADAKLLRELLDRKEERYTNAADGLLGGYMHRKPKEGWDLAFAILRDGRKPLTLRLAVLRVLRYYHGAQPRESRANVLKAMGVVLAQGELADLAVEDLRQWQMWDLTRPILALYGKKGFDAPLMQRAILRYALCCKATAESKDFLAKRRAAEAEVVKEVEESLELEKEK